MSISAICSTADMQAVNDALEAQGFGPSNFSVPAYTGSAASHAALHAWDDPAFLAALQALPAVTITEGVTDPLQGTEDLITAQGAQWGATAPPLTGTTVAGVLYKDAAGTLWSCITGYNTEEYPNPYAIPALIRRARDPYTAQQWIQPLDQYDAYHLINPFTGVGDTALHNGQAWLVTLADGSGNNVWEPGVYGWEVIG